MSAAIVTVALGVMLIAAAWARGDMFGQRCQVAGHSQNSEGLQRCIAQLAGGMGPAPGRSADSGAALKAKESP
jgi:hypothetical protein